MRRILFALLILPMPAMAQTREDVMKELRRQDVPHASIVLAQARLESGNMKSEFYLKTRNLFGMKSGKRYATYKSWRDSVRDYKRRISSRYTGGSYYQFLQKIGYAQDPRYIEKLKEFK